VKALILKIPTVKTTPLKDNREEQPIPLCEGCEAGHYDGTGCIKDKSKGCWLERRRAPTKYEKLVIKPLAFLNSVEGTVHLIVAMIGLWGCVAIKVFDIRVMAPIIENIIFGFFSILTGVVMSRMLKNRTKKRPVL